MIDKFKSCLQDDRREKPFSFFLRFRSTRKRVLGRRGGRGGGFVTCVRDTRIPRSDRRVDPNNENLNDE